jgi:hypothetical protein
MAHSSYLGVRLSRTQHIQVFARGGSATSIASSSSTTSGQAPHDYINCVRYMTFSHIDFASPDKKLSFYLPPRFTYLFIFDILEYSGAAPLQYYSKYT